MRTFGYVRVSTPEQCIDRQTDALKAEGVSEADIFVDRWSGKDFNRPAYQKMLKLMRPGDLLIVLSIDRLGRNYHEILQEWRKLREVIGVDIKILDMPVLNTKQDNDLISDLISDIVLQLLSYVAQTEREFILQRQKEGIAAAKRRGVRFGRPYLPVPVEFEGLRQQWRNNKISAREAGSILHVSHTTFLRWVKEAEAAAQGS